MDRIKIESIAEKLDLYTEKIKNFILLNGFRSDRMIKIKKEIDEQNLRAAFFLHQSKLKNKEQNIEKELIDVFKKQIKYK